MTSAFNESNVEVDISVLTYDPCISMAYMDIGKRHTAQASMAMAWVGFECPEDLVQP